MHLLLDDEELAGVVGWDAEGTSFRIFDSNEFASVALPKYFKHCNLSSFIRQLNIYGFFKRKGRNSVYSHPCFARGKQELIQKIQRKIPGRKSPVSNQLCKNPVIPIVNKLFEISEKGLENSETIKGLEDRISGLKRKNQAVADEIVGSIDRISFIENSLILLGSCFKGSSGVIESFLREKPAKRSREIGFSGIESSMYKQHIEELLASDSLENKE